MLAGDETAAGQLVATRERPERLFPAAFAPLFRGSPPFGVDGGPRTDWNFACCYQACCDIAGMLIGATVRGSLMPPFSSRLRACGQRRRVDHNATGAAAKPGGDRPAHRWQGYAAISRQEHIMLWVRACHNAMISTFSRPRTMNSVKPRLRTWALAHSAVAARCL